MVNNRTARKQRKVRIPSSLKKRSSKTRSVKEGEISCGIKNCEGFSDKHMGGRSLSQEDVIETWGESSFEVRKGRVKICKSCYRKWKKDKKDDKHY